MTVNLIFASYYQVLFRIKVKVVSESNINVSSKYIYHCGKLIYKI